ncbi:MAG TPA: flagellar hook-associated protein FlgK [Armatimonadota bacterium]|jgi:flagellar hook-associated protein 1 FlgK
MAGDLLYVAENALVAHRAALQVIGNNIANAQTPGYVRERPELAVVPGAFSGSVTGSALGHGVELVTVQRLQDRLLSGQIERQAGRSGYFSGRSSSLGQAEALFSDLQGQGISDDLGRFFSTWNTLAASPGNQGARVEALQAAGSLADSFNQRAAELNNLRDKLDQQVQDQVTQVNHKLTSLAELNRRLPECATSAARAGLSDQQDVLLSDLAGLTGAEALRYDDGTVDLVLGGQRLLQGGQAHELRTEPDPLQPGRVQVVLAYSGQSAPLKGQIGGELEVRDQAITQYLSHLDTLAQTLADTVNPIHQQGFDLAGNSGLPLFTYSAAAAAHTLTVNPLLVGHPESLAAGLDGTAGDGSNALALASVRDSKLLQGGRATLEQDYADLVSEIGSDTAAAENLQEAADSVQRGLQNQYDSVSGVNLDEEGVDLIRFQQAYQAASRVVTTALALMDTLLQIK